MKRFPTIAPRPVTPGRVQANEKRFAPVTEPRTFRLYFEWPRVYFQNWPFKKIELSPSNSLRYASHALEFSPSRAGLQQLALAVMIKSGYSISDAIREHKEFAELITVLMYETQDRAGYELQVRKEGNLWRVEKLTRV